MKAKLNRLRMRDLALFVVVAGAVAVAAIFAAREAGLGGGAVAEGEQLVFTLTPEEDHCITGRSDESWGVGSGGARLSDGWVVRTTTWVRWSVSGGEAPYTLKIDGKSAGTDKAEYTGPAGRALVPCVVSSGSYRWGTYSDEPTPFFDSNPNVDSGWKTFKAEVKDASGRKVEATAEFYVILDLGGGGTGDILKRGETYQILGTLMTAPENFDVRVGGVAERECAENDPEPRCHWPIHGFSLVGADAGISLYDDGTLQRRRPEISEVVAGTSSNQIGEAVDSLVDSLGKLPQREEGSD